MKQTSIGGMIALALVVAVAAGVAGTPQSRTAKPAARKAPMVKKVTKTETEWKALLKPEQYRILRQKGTEPAFTGAFWKNHDAGAYLCAGCGLELFRSTEKFDSGTGWPSFWAPAQKAHVHEESDMTLGMVRTEVECARCGGHLGHVFDDGPEPTGLRYCINSAALAFEPAKAPAQAKK